MKNISNKELQRMKQLMGNIKPINENVSLSSVELKKKSPDGKIYGVVRENRKYFIKESNNGVNFDFIGGVANKTKNQFNSYEEAVRQLNFMLEDTDVLTPDIIQEKKFVIKTKKKKSKPAAEEPMDFGGEEETEETDTEEGGDFDFGGEDEGGEEETEEGGDFDFGGEEDTEETEEGDTEEGGDFDFGGEEETEEGDEDTEETDTEDEDLDLEDDPIKGIQKMTGKLGQKLRDTEDLSSDIMKWVAKSVLSALDLEQMDSEDKKDIIRAVKKKKEDSSEEMDFMDEPEENDITDWDSLSAKEKSKFVRGISGEDEMYGPGDGDVEKDEIILDNDDENCSYCGDRDYNDMNINRRNQPNTDYMSRFAKNVKRTVSGKKMDSHELGIHLEKIQNKLGGPNVVSIDNNMAVGEFGYVEVKPTGYVLHKEGSKFGKTFGFNELGKLQKYVGQVEEDYMEDPYMMPQPAPSKPQERPDAPTKPGRPDTDKPNPTKRPFTAPPHITPGEEPNPKAEYNEYDGIEDYGPNEGMSYMEEPNYYGSFEKDRWFTPIDSEAVVKGPSYEYEDFEYPDYESFRSSEFGQDPKNKWFLSAESGKKYFDMYSKKFGPMKVRKKIETDFDQTSKMFDDLDYMEDNDVDLGPTIKGRPSNNPIAARGNVSKTYLTDVQKTNREARKQANNDISKHFRREGDFLGQEPSDKWGRYSLPYDTKFSDEDYMEDDNSEICSSCEGRGHEQGGIGFGRVPKLCITCAGSGQIPRMEAGYEVDEPYTDNNPMNYKSNDTLPKNVGYKYQYKEKFNFPFNMGENKRKRKSLNEDHLNDKMETYEQGVAYEDVEDMAKLHGLDIKYSSKDRSKDPEEKTIYLDLTSKGKTVAKVRINSAGEIEMGDMKAKTFKGQPVDSHSDFDEVLGEKNIKVPMNPAPAPSKPQTRPDTPTKPGKPGTDKPNPTKRPFTAPPHITPGEEPNPKARFNRR